MVVNSPQLTSVAPTRSVPAQWASHVGCFLLTVTLVLTVFGTATRAAIHAWVVSPTFSHCFLIIPISLWLIWQRLPRLQPLTPGICPTALLGLIPLLMLVLLGKLIAINEVEQFSMIAIVQILAASMLGLAIYRKLLFPFLFLFFLVPTGEYLIEPLQAFTSWFIAAGLDILTIPNYREGTVIELANGRFEVAEACAGLRFLIATITLGTLFSALMFRRWYKILIFVAACVVVPVIGNGLRALGIVMLAHFSDNRLARGADHIVYGWGFSVAILVLLLFIGARFRDEDAPRGNLVRVAYRGPATSRGILATTAIAALIIFAAQALVWQSDVRMVPSTLAGRSHMGGIEGWAPEPGTLDWSPKFDTPDAQLAASRIGEGDATAQPVDLMIDYYRGMRKGHELVSSSNRLWDPATWHLIGQHPVNASLGTAPVAFVESIIAAPAGRRLVWSCYWIDGRFTTSGMLVKMLQLRDALLGGHGAALIAISTRIDEAEGDARGRLKAATATLGALSGRLTAAVAPPPADDI